jgi:FeS assembly SUF system regulator
MKMRFILNNLKGIFRMIKVSKLADYAVVILTVFARGDQALLNASTIASRTGLPDPTVAKVLKILTRDGLLESVRGSSGGYILPRKPAEISVAEIIGAVDGPISLTACVEGGGETCGYQSSCPVRGRWDGVNEAMRGALESVSLADMMSHDRHPERRAEGSHAAWLGDSSPQAPRNDKGVKHEYL